MSIVFSAPAKNYKGGEVKFSLSKWQTEEHKKILVIRLQIREKERFKSGEVIWNYFSKVLLGREMVWTFILAEWYF